MSADVGGLDRVAANERLILRLVKTQGGGATIELACECTSPVCDERIEVTPAQYQPVCVSAARYVVCPDDEHVDSKLDRVIETQLRYWVVEREPSVEMIAFCGPLERTITSEFSVLANESTWDGDDPPGLAAVPMDVDDMGDQA